MIDRRFGALLSLFLLHPACALEVDGWDDDLDDEVGHSQLAISSTEPGYVTTDWNDPLANHCAVDPTWDILTGLDSDPSYIQAYRSGKTIEFCNGDVYAPYWVGAPDAYHRQGIQRINRNSTNYFFVTHSVPPPEDTAWYPGFEVVEMGAHGVGRFAMGSGGATPTTQAPCPNHIVKYWEYSSPDRRHAGGMQVNGNYAVVAFEQNPLHMIPASFRTVNVSNPPTPTSGPTVFRQKGATKHGSSAALTRTNDGKFLIMVFGNNAADVEVFVSAGTSMPTTPGNWHSKIAKADPFGATWEKYQNVQFITECDTDTSGRLFLLATHKNDSSEDWADLYRVTFNTTTYEPTFVKWANRNMTCSSSSTGGTRYCDFDAGAGSYVDPDGNLILYGVEHYNDHFNPNTDYGVKVREFAKP